MSNFLLGTGPRRECWAERVREGGKEGGREKEEEEEEEEEMLPVKHIYKCQHGDGEQLAQW